MHYPRGVQISAGTALPFSTRTKAIVEHPVFLRLRTVKQLGTTDTIYPSCTHTRLEHSLGVFRVCWLYLQALESDPFNPLFRQLTDTHDLKALLLAALLHDLGQYPLAHELEDAASANVPDGDSLRTLFRHEILTVRWLKSAATDTEGRTIAQIIENPEWGWGISLDAVIALVSSEASGELPLNSQTLKVRLLRTLIDGPIDVDKLDYLIRDSERAGLLYGKSIDLDRLVRNLTVVLSKDDDGRTALALGAYEKGQSAAESVTFARYQLYQTLYWHHAARAIRPMLREVLRFSNFPQKGKNSFQEAFESLLGIGGSPTWNSVESVLDLLARYASDDGKQLLAMIQARRFYKRLVTVHSHPELDGSTSLLSRFRNLHHRHDFDSELQAEIKKRFEAFKTAAVGPQPTVLTEQNTDWVLEELDKPGRILCDCPTPRTGSQEKLRFAIEPKRRLQNYAIRVEVGERVSEVWQQVYSRLMDIASKGRVYCHPKIRDALMAALGPSGIQSALKKVIEKLR
jgi:HD superfamily phosphohydrolase